MAPVGRGQSPVRVNDPKGGRKAAYHAAGSVWFTRLFVDTLDEHIIRWGCLGKLQDNLICPVPRMMGQGLVTRGTLRILPDFDTFIELPPKLERDGRDFDVANLVPRDECVV